MSHWGKVASRDADAVSTSLSKGSRQIGPCRGRSVVLRRGLESRLQEVWLEELGFLEKRRLGGT
jgi:hypothetical protein